MKSTRTAEGRGHVRVALAIAACTMTVAGAVPQATTRAQGTAATLCKDELGQAYSPGAMRKVVDQLQACAAGIWILDPSTPPKDPPPANAKSCVSDRAADKGQEYGAGLFRVFDDPSTKKQTIERCDNGSWKKAPGSRAR